MTACLVLLAGCSKAAENRQVEEERVEQAAVSAGFKPGGPAPMATVAVDPVPVAAPGTALPPDSMQYRYIGRWAASVPLCRDGAWTFETRKLTTAGETSCTFTNVAAALEGYKLEGTCSAEGRDQVETVELSFDEAKKRMRVAGKTLGPAELLYCGA